MRLDPEFLRQHYASLSDEALLALNRADLVEAAQQVFDAEVRRREFASPPKVSRSAPSPPLEEEAEPYDQPNRDSTPDWLEDAAEVYSRYVAAGTTPAPEAVHARDVLEAAEIPCYLELHEESEEQSRETTYRWRILVPGKFTNRATGVLDRDIFNDEFESGWRTHLEMLSDRELREMDPEYAFCGLYDRIERITRAYDEELARRGLTS